MLINNVNELVRLTEHHEDSAKYGYVGSPKYQLQCSLAFLQMSANKNLDPFLSPGKK